MNSIATQGLPLPGLAPASATSGVVDPVAGLTGEAGLLSGEQFLQMLLGLGGFSEQATGEALPAATEDREEESVTMESDESEGVPAWLPIAAFVASAVKPAAPAPLPESLPVGRDKTAMPQVVASVTAASTSPVQVLAAQPEVPPEAKASPVIATAVEQVADSLISEGVSPAPLAERPSTPVSLSSLQSLAASVGTTFGTERPTFASAAASVPVHQQVHAPVHSPRWAEEVGQRIALMAINGTQSGSLSLVPEQLGPIEVKIHMSQDTANVWFSASQADTRAAIQDALPRLREMFSATGLSLGEAQVSQQMPQKQNDAPAPGRGGYARENDIPLQAAQPQQRVGLGLLDTYA